ncbi:hypothetical protein VO54_03521 [Elizabethkingia miricola]|nr:hypothetical protein VO54_03521 [Elizabethkingia miricola]
MIYSIKKYISIRISISLLMTCFFIFLTVNAATLEYNKSIIALNGPWKFKTGDNKKWSDSNFDDSKWEIVDFTAPIGAHDGDVGLSGYIEGWTSKGHPEYSGYAWYRIKVPLDNIKGNVLALTGPPAVDDAYQLFINGILIGNAGDFSDPVPIAYSIQPKMFLLPEKMRKEKEITIAFRVWMSVATLSQIPDAGGIHIAPLFGEKNNIELKYRSQWGQTIKGYIVDVIEPILFILLAIVIFILYKPTKQYKWFSIALLLLALARANQAFFYWLQVESAHEIDLVTTVILVPLVLGAWIIAWQNWYELNQLRWIPKIIIIITPLYIMIQFLGLPWLSDTILYTTFQSISQYIRLIFILLMGLIIYHGIQQQHGKTDPLSLLAVLFVSIGLFAPELSALNIKGIWFPYGVGVSRTQYAYAAFIIVMFIKVILQKQKKVLF